MTPTTIKKETYVESDDKTRHALTYDMLMGLHDKFDRQVTQCSARFTKLENNKRRNTVIASGSGFIGGFIAILGKFFLDKS